MPRQKPTKMDTVRRMLARSQGASLAAICKTTGWQPHSARAALSTLRKAGVNIERRPSEAPGAPSTYHLLTRPETAT